MQLKVRLYTGALESGETNLEVRTFLDIRRVGNETARAVRDWLRQVPMTPGPKHHQVNIYATWVETVKGPGHEELPLKVSLPGVKRKRKARK